MRGTVLESRVSVLVVLEKAQLEKVDRVAGPGNRSSYIRWLVDTVDENNLRREIELEAMNKMLQKLPAQLEKRIVRRDLKIAELKNRLHALKNGKGEEEEEKINGLDAVQESYKAWMAERYKYYPIITGEVKLEWVKHRARSLDMEPDELLYILEKRERFHL